MKDTKIFCHQPWTNLGVNSKGRIKPCCRWTPNEILDDFGQEMNVRTHTIEQYKKSKSLQVAKDTFLRGEWPVACERCKQEEDNGVPSKRQMDFDRWEKDYEGYDFETGGFITANLALGGTCNLKCIMCRPGISSSWIKEWNAIYNTSYEDFKVPKHNLVQQFTESAPHLINLDVTGGEPILNELDQLKAMLQFYIDSDHAKNMRVHLTTNVTLFPDDSVMEILSHFGMVEWQLSIDGINERFEYIRFKAKWETSLPVIMQFIEAEKKYDNMSLSVSHTLSTYNAYYLDEFIEWANSVGLPKPYVGPVYEPLHLRPAALPTEARAKIAEHLGKSSNEQVRQWADFMKGKAEDPALFEEFLEFSRKHDEYRGVDFRQVFPELAQILEDAGGLNGYREAKE